MKRFCKNIVLSATYRQDSSVSEEQRRKDPQNTFLARGPSFRLSAEQIRDLTLASSGLLNRQAGGPPVSPYQPGGDLWRESNGMSPPYQQSVGKALYRRSIYSIWKRTVPLPNMMAFDSTTREVCTVKRARTNTPLQALVLMNDIQFIESARVLAEELCAASDEESRINNAFVRLAGRRITKKESEVLKSFYDEEKAFFREHPEQAKQFISIGERTPNAKLDPVELAAMTTVCQSILNLDATIWRR